MNEKLNEKLIDFAGIFVNNLDDDHWIGLYEDKVIHLEPFTESLDACFKWLVPKIDYFELYHRIGVDLSHLVPMPDYAEVYTKVFPYDKTITPAHWHFYEVKILVVNDWYEGVAKTPALALCKAIEQLIDKEKE